MLKLLRNIYAGILITATINLFTIGSLSAEPMDDVFSMLEDGGGTSYSQIWCMSSFTSSA